MKSILIVLMGSVGDVARGLSILPPLRAAHPQAKITWLIEPKSKDLLEFALEVDEVILFERGSGLPALLRLQRNLAGRTFDLTLDLQRHFKSGVFSWLSRAPRRIGFHRQDAKEFNWIFQTETIPTFGDELPKIEHYGKFLEHLGINTSLPSRPNVQLERLRNKLPESLRDAGTGFIAVVLGSAWKSKDWHPDGYRELIPQLLQERSEPVVLVGDWSTVALAEAIASHAKSQRVLNLAGRTTLQELVAVLGCSRFGIGPDSGPGHIAAWLGVRYISLFGPTDPVRTAPKGSEDLVIASHVACAPCYRRECPGLGTICMRLISPHAVMEKVRGL